ncbi:hypothetical protein R3W88_011487 [Solanum pinnatisectum]|uniref:Reverse transcriptase zinc-binding domain-containing protein n=1 Tax=Solanum pinnatisectum TaxID=50273 RepID=A0AAV9L6N2_9SOLN|nr:hypothetical protein R3W88_011487 [Solanum pinnatisectum]
MMLPKHRIILWIVSQNRILTKERMNRLNISVDDLTCCLYKLEKSLVRPEFESR